MAITAVMTARRRLLLSGPINCGMVTREGVAKEKALRWVMPANTPVMPLAMQTAARGLFSGILIPYSAGSVTPATSAETPEANASH